MYDLQGWGNMDLDALIDRAVAAVATAQMTDTGKTLHLAEDDAILLYAGDVPGDTSYGEYKVPLPAANYQVLEGVYENGRDKVIIYRVRPASSRP